MAIVSDSALREQLLDRRGRLESVIAGTAEHAELSQLLNEVDSALQRIDARTYGICETCHEPIELDRLAVNPLLRFCIPHLTQPEQRALEQDLELAAQIQRELLPQQNLRHDGWEVYYHYEPLGPVSGDYCDVVSQRADGGGLFFAVGDVSGKGVAASMLMAQLRAIFRMLVGADVPLAQQIERANRAFCESALSNHFATLVWGRADASGEVELSNAGHVPPLLVRASHVTSIEATGLPLGIFCSGNYTTRKLRLAPGESLVLFTDGLTEAVDGSDCEFGLERLSRLIAGHPALLPKALVEGCIESLAGFLAGAPKRDDLSIMAIHRRG